MGTVDRIPARALGKLDTIVAEDGSKDLTNVLMVQPTPDHGMFILEVPWLAEANVEDATARYFAPGATVLVQNDDDNWD